MKQLEKTLLVLVVVAIGMKLAGVSGSALLVTLGFLLLMLFYLLLGSFILNDIPFYGMFRKESYRQAGSGNIVSGILAGMVLSLSLPGSLFVIMRWDGARVMWVCSFLLLCLLLVTAIIVFAVKRTAFRRQLLLRSGIMMAALLAVSWL